MLLPDQYFKAYGRHLAECGNPKQAWDATEKEFCRTYAAPEDGVVLRRFSSYESFHSAYRRYKKAGEFCRQEIHILIIPLEVK